MASTNICIAAYDAHHVAAAGPLTACPAQIEEHSSTYPTLPRSLVWPNQRARVTSLRLLHGCHLVPRSQRDGTVRPAPADSRALLPGLEVSVPDVSACDSLKRARC